MKPNDDYAGMEMVRQGLMLLGVKNDKLAEKMLDIADGIRDDDTLVPVPLGELMTKGIKRQRTTIGHIEGAAEALFAQKTLSMVFGSDNAGKSWFMMEIAAQEVRAGHNILWIDYETSEDNIEPLIERAMMLGLTSDQINRFITFVPREGLRPTHHDQWFTLVREQKVTLVVFDSYGEMLARSGLDENRDADIANLNTRYIKQLASQGAAVVLVDHVTKSGDLDWPSGSKRKRASITGSAYALSVGPEGEEHGFTQHEPGYATIHCKKSRLGTHRKGEVVGVMEVEPGLVHDDENDMLVVDQPIGIRLISRGIHENEATTEMVTPATLNADTDMTLIEVLTESSEPCTARTLVTLMHQRHIEMTQASITTRLRELNEASLVVYLEGRGWVTAAKFVSQRNDK